jgi:acyl-CoA synthetase (AMP-forming)/AMP-acid ligase II
MHAYRGTQAADQRLIDIVVIDTMPLTSTGKLDRVALRLAHGG